MSRIEWTAGRHNTHTGRVGGLEFFGIHWGTTRHDPFPWKVTSTLPLRFRLTNGGALSESDAKRQAEAILTLFMDRIGATFNEE